MARFADTRFLKAANFWIYVAKCLVGLTVCYLIDAFLPGRRLYWSIISVLLVLSPDDSESRKLPFTRMKANIVGSVIGLGCFMLPIPSLAAMLTGVVLTLVVCSFLSLGAGTRSALAALVIVLIQEYIDQEPVSAFQRMLSVLLGCLVGLGVTTAANLLPALFRKLLRERRRT
jgi:Predicted membrane protein